MFIPDDVIENIRESNDIVDVISEYVSLKKGGKNFVGLCPFHNEKTPSFSVQQEKQMYYCFGCGEGGNVISFIMKYKGFDFLDAVKMLADRANIVIPESNEDINQEKIDLKGKLYNLNTETAKYFYLNLANNVTALAYLKNRGIEKDIINKFKLGYSKGSWDDLIKYLNSKGIDLDLIEKAGLVIKNEKGKCYDRFRNRVMFPVFDVRGRIIGFGGRVLDDSKPKYLNSPETMVFNKGSNLYGLNLTSANNKDRKIIIVEGYMDVIALHTYGINNAVASLGTALTKEQAKLIKRYSDEVIICYDSDEAGQAATLRGLDILSNAGCRVNIINIPKGKDPDEYIRLEGKDAFVKCIDNAIPLIEYKLKRKSEGFDISTTEGKIGFVKSSASVLAGIDDSVTIDAYITKLSADTGVSSSALYEEIKRQRVIASKDVKTDEKYIKEQIRYNNKTDGQKLYLEPAYLKAEKCILYIISNMKEYGRNVTLKLSYDDFNDETYKKAAEIIYKRLEENNEIKAASIIDSFNNIEDRKKVAEIFSTNINIETNMNNMDRVVEDYINKIKNYKLVNRRRMLLSKVNELEKERDVQQVAIILKEITEIEKQLRVH